MKRLEEALSDEIDETYDLIPMSKEDESFFLRNIRRVDGSLRVALPEDSHKIIVSCPFKKWLIAKTTYGNTFDLFVMSGKAIYPANIGAPKEEIIDVIKKAIRLRDIFTY